MKYSLSRNGQIIGSYTLEELRTYMNEGRVIATDHVLPEGGSQWMTVAQLFPPAPPPELAPAGGAPTAVPPINVPPPPPTIPPKPQTYLVQAILVTLFCCLPAGIAAIVFSTQVDSRYARGDHAGAQLASKRAATWSWVSFGVGLVGGVIYFAFVMLSALKDVHG